MNIIAFAGVDVSKKHLDIAVRPSGRRLRVDNTPEGHLAFVSLLHELGPVLVVVEPTGGYETALVAPKAVRASIETIIKALSKQIDDADKGLQSSSTPTQPGAPKTTCSSPSRASVA